MSMTETERLFLTPTYRETCGCGAYFETHSASIAARQRDIESFREAHRVCRERAVPANEETDG